MSLETKKRSGLITVNTSISDILVELLNGNDTIKITQRRRYRMRARKLIEPGTPIRLTKLGRRLAITRKMRLGPMEMFLLSDLYVDYTLRKERKMKPFPYSFRQLEDVLMMVFDMSTIYNLFWRLKRYGAVEKKATKLYTITDRWAKRLDRYHDDVFEICESTRREMFI